MTIGQVIELLTGLFPLIMEYIQKIFGSFGNNGEDETEAPQA